MPPHTTFYFQGEKNNAHAERIDKRQCKCKEQKDRKEMQKHKTLWSFTMHKQSNNTLLRNNDFSSTALSREFITAFRSEQSKLSGGCCRPGGEW